MILVLTTRSSKKRTLKTHTCSSVCDPDSYMLRSKQATSGAEPINSSMDIFKITLAISKPD